MKNYIKSLLLFLLLSGITSIKAQDAFTNYKTAMSTIFAKIDRRSVSTGFLIDYGLQLIPPSYYDGTLKDSNEVDMPVFQKLYAGIDYARFNANSALPSLSSVIATLATNTPAAGQAIPFTVMSISYNRLKSNAKDLGLITISNNQIYIVAGKYPYEIKTLFATTPVIKDITSSTVQFIFKPELYFSNVAKDIVSTMVDVGDGKGFRTIIWNQAFTVTYPSSGSKSFVVKCTFNDGSVLQSHGKVNVSFNTILKSSTPTYSNSNTYQYFPATSNYAGGTAYYVLGSGHTQITKPLIVAEGYNPWKIMTPNDPKENMAMEHLLDLSNQFSLLHKLKGTINVPLSTGFSLRDYLYSQGYDIIYVDNDNGTGDIVANAKLFEQVIAWVNRIKVGKEPNVVMGVSMGGLVARYALCDLEQLNYDHQTKVFISMDSPHDGANIPIGAQAALCSIKDINAALGLSDGVTKTVKLFNEPATQQMLMYKVSNVNGSLVVSDNTSNSFMNTLHAMGYPRYCYNVAISDGAGDATTVFSPGSTLVDYTIEFSKWWEELLLSMLEPFVTGFSLKSIIPGVSELKVNCHINAVPSSSGQVYSTRVYVDKKVLGIIPTTRDIINMYCTSPSGMPTVDGTAGGLYDLTEVIGKLPSNNLSNSIYQKQFCFIPATSAIGLTDWKTPITTNVRLKDVDYRVGGQTVFQEYYLSPTNNIHTLFYTTDNSLADFIKNKLDNMNSYCTLGETIANLPFVNTTQTISKCNLNMKNVSIKSNSTIFFNVIGSTHIDGPFNVELGSRVVDLK